MISDDELAEFERALDRCEGYAELGMIDAAEEELQRVPVELKETLPYFVMSMKFFIRMGWWDNAAQVGLRILEKWPGQCDVRQLTLHCVAQSGSRIRFSDPGNPGSDFLSRWRRRG